jgi:hypothetical protein
MLKKELPPLVIHDGAALLLYSPVDARHRYTGNSRHRVNGKVLSPSSCLIIYYCGDGGVVSYYLLGYNPHWQEDQWSLTRHPNLEEAQARQSLSIKA